MMRLKWVLLGLIVLLSLLFARDLIQQDTQTNSEQTSSVDLRSWLGQAPSEGFTRAIKPRDFVFPRDHGAHENFQIEWWYVTGNVSGAGKSGIEREFGYQVTFFRVGLKPPIKNASSDQSPWSTQNIWMAHVALADIDANKHYHDERLSRGAARLAGAQLKPFKVWVEDWQIVGDEQADFPWMIKINSGDFALDLTLSPKKPMVLQGNKGLSQKSHAVGNASYYYSFTRLDTQGTVTTYNTDKSSHSYAVKGLSWLDREWSTNPLGENQAGWNWFSLQIDDGKDSGQFNGQDVMFYQLHNTDGSIDPISFGKWVESDGQYESLTHQQVQLKPITYWHSDSGKKYVTEWEMQIPDRSVAWTVKAVMNDQEMLTTVRYWEGAVRVYDQNGQQIGKGYLEMTGY